MKKQLLQLRVLGFGFFQDRDFGIGIFPKHKKPLIGGESPDAGGIGVRSLRGSRLQGVGTSHSQMRKCSRPTIPDDAAVVENLLKLYSGGGALSGGQIGLSTNVSGIQTGEI